MVYWGPSVVWWFYPNALSSLLIHHPSFCVGTQSQYLSAAVLGGASPGRDQVVGRNWISATVKGPTSIKLSGIACADNMGNFTMKKNKDKHTRATAGLTYKQSSLREPLSSVDLIETSFNSVDPLHVKTPPKKSGPNENIWLQKVGSAWLGNNYMWVGIPSMAEFYHCYQKWSFLMFSCKKQVILTQKVLSRDRTFFMFPNWSILNFEQCTTFFF